MNDPLIDAFIYSLIVGLVFLRITYHINRSAARDATEVLAAYDALPVPPALPLLDLNMDIIVTDAAGRRWKVHFGVMDVQMVEDDNPA